MTLASVAARAGSEGGGDLREASDVAIAADEMMRVTRTPRGGRGGVYGEGRGEGMGEGRGRVGGRVGGRVWGRVGGG